MDTAALVLLIIVSAVLALFLLVLIVALVYFIGVLKQVKRITTQAESTVDSMQAAASAFERSASPLAMLKLIGNIVNQAAKINKKRGR